MAKGTTKKAGTAKNTTAAAGTTAAAPAATETAAAKETKPEVVRIRQNGYTRPKDGSTTGRVWAIADEISKKAGQPAERKAVLEQAVAENLNPSMAASQYSRWRGFHGLIGKKAPGRTAKPEAPAPAEGAVETPPPPAPAA